MSTSVVVKTRTGDVRGCVADGVNVFKGIPYAAPPFGVNRLLPPQPAARWSGARDALAFGPKSPQPPYPPPVDVMIPEFVGPGEDCLTLNVWSPGVGAGRQPVMVWIPGGVFEYHGTGAAPWYDGARFARDGIVCVTINYRVGAEGFLYFGAGNANRGLLDQIAALQWVQQNIAAFGGDVDNVTVFGESAGSMSIASMLSMPRAKSLFRRAILQSGAAHPVMSATTARRVCELLAEKLGVPATREAIAALPVDRLLRAQTDLRADLEADPDPQRWGPELVLSMMPWHPVIDGDVIRAHPLDRIAAGAAADIDVIVGTNTEEHRLFLVSVGAIDRVTQGKLDAAIAAYGLPIDPTLALYRAADPRAGAGDLLAAVQTAWFWRMPAVRLADAHAKSAKAASTYMYEFAWRSPQFNGLLGACHSLEIPFVFDTLGRGTDAMWGSAPPQALADAVHAKWVAFAKTGDCGWSKYDLSRRATMRFDVASAVIDDPRRDERALWAAAREHLQPVG